MYKEDEVSCKTRHVSTDKKFIGKGVKETNFNPEKGPYVQGRTIPGEGMGITYLLFEVRSVQEVRWDVIWVTKRRS